MSVEQIGVFESMSRGLSHINDLASDIGVPTNKLAILLNVLAGSGLIAKNDKSYYFAEDFSTLNPTHPASQNGYIQYATEVRNRWLGLTQSVQGIDVGKENFGEITGRDKAATQAFMAAMHANAHSQAIFIAKEYDFEGHHILDVGAGTGIYSTQVIQTYQNTSAVLLDLPDVVPITEEYVEKSEVAKQIQVVPANYHDGLPLEQFDDLFMFAVIHQESDEEALSLLRKAHSVLRPGGRLFLTSFFLNEERTEPPFSAMFAVEMLVMVAGGKAYTHDEIKNLLTAANFAKTKRVDKIPGPATLYIATK